MRTATHTHTKAWVRMANNVSVLVSMYDPILVVDVHLLGCDLCLPNKVTVALSPGQMSSGGTQPSPTVSTLNHDTFSLLGGTTVVAKKKKKKSEPICSWLPASSTTTTSSSFLPPFLSFFHQGPELTAGLMLIWRWNQCSRCPLGAAIVRHCSSCMLSWAKGWQLKSSFFCGTVRSAWAIYWPRCNTRNHHSHFCCCLQSLVVIRGTAILYWLFSDWCLIANEKWCLAQQYFNSCSGPTFSRWCIALFFIFFWEKCEIYNVHSSIWTTVVVLWGRDSLNCCDFMSSRCVSTLPMNMVVKNFPRMFGSIFLLSPTPSLISHMDTPGLYPQLCEMHEGFLRTDVNSR